MRNVAGAVAKCNYSTINDGFEIFKSRYIVVKIHFATAPWIPNIHLAYRLFVLCDIVIGARKPR